MSRLNKELQEAIDYGRRQGLNESWIPSWLRGAGRWVMGPYGWIFVLPDVVPPAVDFMKPSILGPYWDEVPGDPSYWNIPNPTYGGDGMGGGFGPLDGNYNFQPSRL